MKKTKRLFSVFNRQRGGMLVELMLSIALAAIIIPFVFRYQEQAVSRAKNIAVTKQMESVQNSLERYIVENKTELIPPSIINISQETNEILCYDNSNYYTFEKVPKYLISTCTQTYNNYISDDDDEY